MKDEEMAEEWVRTQHNILKDCSSACVRAEHKNEIQAFLAGLKAGRPQWHDLRKDKTDLPLHFVEWREQFYNTRLDVMIGFNTKQPWVYDNIRDVYIDPPAEVLDSLPNWREDSDKTEEALLEICKTEPDWLLERQFWYGDEDFEI